MKYEDIGLNVVAFNPCPTTFDPPHETLVMCRRNAVVIDCAKLETASLKYGKIAPELMMTLFSDDRILRQFVTVSDCP